MDPEVAALNDEAKAIADLLARRRKGRELHAPSDTSTYGSSYDSPYAQDPTRRIRAPPKVRNDFPLQTHGLSDWQIQKQIEVTRPLC